MNGTEFGMFYNSYDLSSKAFCLVWFLSTSWYLIINITRAKLRNYFRIQTTFNKAQYVQIEKNRNVIQVMESEGKHRFKVVEDLTRHLLGFDMLVKTVAVMENNQHRYFEFQSTRYSLDPSTNAFKPAFINISMDRKDLLGMEAGLDDETAQNRLETLGPNFIQVRVPNFIKAFWQE